MPAALPADPAGQLAGERPDRSTQGVELRRRSGEDVDVLDPPGQRNGLSPASRLSGEPAANRCGEQAAQPVDALLTSSRSWRNSNSELSGCSLRCLAITAISRLDRSRARITR